jgi:glycosyltransferase involved in cell wall biosynthesis
VNSKLAILATGYGSGATRGQNLGTAGYSYDFVVQLFEPLLRECGDFQLIETAETGLSRKMAGIRERGQDPVFLCFRGLHDAVFADDAPTVLVPAWEFPDVPNQAFDGNWKHNWVHVANESARIIVHGEFTRRAFTRAGVRAPLSIVPVPTPAAYFELDDWAPEPVVRIERPVIVLGDHRDSPSDVLVTAQMANIACDKGSPGFRSDGPANRFNLRSPAGRAAKHLYKQVIRPLLPHWLDRGLTVGGRAALTELCNVPFLGQGVKQAIDLSGVVYTSIFNPTDGRKNWDDLLTAFLIGLKDHDDAMLVLKLIGRDRHKAGEILARYRGLNLRHRCRVAIITDYLTDAEMLDLTRGSTYYVTSTRAEGNCLPLMNFLAAGRPGISPSHTAIADYFTHKMGFIVESHAEPCAWPHDPQLRSRSTWHRLVWPSLVEAFRESYRVARSEPARMREMSEASRIMSWDRHHPINVLPRLAEALDQVIPSYSAQPIRAVA